MDDLGVPLWLRKPLYLLIYHQGTVSLMASGKVWDPSEFARQFTAMTEFAPWPSLQTKAWSLLHLESLWLWGIYIYVCIRIYIYSVFYIYRIIIITIIIITSLLYIIIHTCVYNRVYIYTHVTAISHIYIDVYNSYLHTIYIYIYIPGSSGSWRGNFHTTANIDQFCKIQEKKNSWTVISTQVLFHFRTVPKNALLTLLERFFPFQNVGSVPNGKNDSGVLFSTLTPKIDLFWVWS